MLQSQIFAKTTKETPKEEISANAQLLIRAGFVDKLMAGVYSYLPLGFKVLKKIENIIRQEMEEIGGQEILMPSLHPKNLWEKTDRWKYEEMFKLKSRNGKDFGLGWTHEEIVVPLLKKFIKSYKDLPVFVYQIQDKFRDELRVKSGLLRGVEFLMKDLYSFHQDEKDLDAYYEKVKKAYFRIFERCGIKKETFLTLAAGGTFSKYSHEFQTVTEAGEDVIYLCPKCRLAVNKEIIEEENYACPSCRNKKLEIRKAIETGNIFKLKEKFSETFDFRIKNKDGKESAVLMGCYGIGLGRLMGAVAEVHHDEKGIVWPEEIAPFKVHLIAIPASGQAGQDKKMDSRKITVAAEKIYRDLQKSGLEVLYDDRDKSPAEKFADADLIGLPYRIIVSQRTLRENCLEVKKRKEKKAGLLKIKELNSYFRKNS